MKQKKLPFPRSSDTVSTPVARLAAIELCAGGGGQALGLEQAGFRHTVLVENDRHACATLRLNRAHWNVAEQDLQSFSLRSHEPADLLAAGLPCPPFSVAGKQLGTRDERNLFPEALRIVAESRPRAVMIENVRGFLDPAFEGYRMHLRRQLLQLGYESDIRLLNASDYGVPQLRPRVVIVAAIPSVFRLFEWPLPHGPEPATVGETLYSLMKSRGWKFADRWRLGAAQIAPTIVGGSKKHGGPDLGPTRARNAWATLGVDGCGLANAPPEPDFDGTPRLTVEMVALLQGFPPDWRFAGGKTAAYRQIGNAFPPPVACAVARQLRIALLAASAQPVAV